MARLILPTKVYGAGRGNKYHLVNPKSKGTTACGTSYGMNLAKALGGEKLINDVKAEDICLKCLGPCFVED